MIAFSLSPDRRNTSELLHKAGIPKALIPETFEVAKHTVERWLDQEIEQGNLPQVIQMVKGQEQVNGTPTLLEELNDLLIAKLIVRLEVDYSQAQTAAATLLPLILDHLVEHLQLNPQFNAWWENLNMRKHLFSKKDLLNPADPQSNPLSGNHLTDKNSLS